VPLRAGPHSPRRARVFTAFLSSCVSNAAILLPGRHANLRSESPTGCDTARARGGRTTGKQARHSGASRHRAPATHALRLHGRIGKSRVRSPFTCRNFEMLGRPLASRALTETRISSMIWHSKPTGLTQTSLSRKTLAEPPVLVTTSSGRSMRIVKRCRRGEGAGGGGAGQGNVAGADGRKA
jgi:hypothetical protein